MDEERTPDSLWEGMKEAMFKVAETAVGFVRKMPSKPWITKRIIELAEEKRLAMKSEKKQYK